MQSCLVLANLSRSTGKQQFTIVQARTAQRHGEQICIPIARVRTTSGSSGAFALTDNSESLDQL